MKILYGDNTFTLSVYDNEIYLWDKDGRMSLMSLNYDKEAPFSTVFQVIVQYMNDYNNGIIHCSDCNKPLNKDEIAGRFFAGCYCDECWEREWKERESNETYN